jgi:hypothetical protein
MSVRVRPASLQDGVAVLALLEAVGYYPEPISFAQTYRKTLANPQFLVRVAEAEGKIIGMASLSLRYQLGLGGLLACLDELAVAPGPYKNVDPALWGLAGSSSKPTKALLRRAPRNCPRQPDGRALERRGRPPDNPLAWCRTSPLTSRAPRADSRRSSCTPLRSP